MRGEAISAESTSQWEQFNMLWKTISRNLQKRQFIIWFTIVRRLFWKSFGWNCKYPRYWPDIAYYRVITQKIQLENVNKTTLHESVVARSQPTAICGAGFTIEESQNQGSYYGVCRYHFHTKNIACFPWSHFQCEWIPNYYTIRMWSPSMSQV